MFNSDKSTCYYFFSEQETGTVMYFLPSSSTDITIPLPVIFFLHTGNTFMSTPAGPLA